MQTHPYFGSIIDRMIGISIAIVTWIVFALLLYCYGNVSWWMAGLDGLVSIALLAIAGYVYGYVVEAIHSLKMDLILGALVQAISLLGAWEVEVGLWQGSWSDFMATLPLRLVFGILAWIILLMWYQIYNLEEQNLIDSIEPDQPEENDIATTLSPETADEKAENEKEMLLDRVSVKNGSRIHIIHLEELLYLLSGGDYVTLFTPDGQYVKEQTMKYFETHLPPISFVRIHRSCIVNIEQILRIELFGKENYQVRLKNNVCLKASLSGYKLLKERLQL